MSRLQFISPESELQLPNPDWYDFVGEFTEYTPDASRVPAIVATGAEIVDEADIDPAFFTAQDNAIGLLFAATLRLRAQNERGKSSERIAREQNVAEFYGAVLLDPYREPAADTEAESCPRDVLTQFENPDLTKELQEWFRTSKEVDKVRKSLEVDAESEQGFEVVVLSVGTNATMNDLTSIIDGFAISDARRDEILENNAVFSSSTEFTEDAIPEGFVAIHADGGATLCISEPIAQAMVSTGQGFEPVLHELVHTQGDLSLSDPKRPKLTGLLGLALEERRANAYGVDPFDDPLKIGDLYYRMTDELDEIYNITGVSVMDVMMTLKMGGGGDRTQFYSALAAKLGLVQTALVSGCVPGPYEGVSDSADSLMRAFDLEDELTLRLPHSEIEGYIDRVNVPRQKRKHIRSGVARVKERMR